MQTDFRAPACRLSHKAWPIHSGLSKTVRLQPKFSKSFAAVSGWMWMFTVTRCARHPWHPVATDFALGNLLLSCLTGITRLSVTLKKSEKYENMLHIVASCCINSASRSICPMNRAVGIVASSWNQPDARTAGFIWRW